MYPKTNPCDLQKTQHWSNQGHFWWYQTNCFYNLIHVYVYDVYVKKLEILGEKKRMFKKISSPSRTYPYTRGFSIAKVPSKYIHVYVIIFHQDTCGIVSVQKNV